jgi:hypothetical protein
METPIKLPAAKEAAEKVESATSAAKAANGNKGLIAALKKVCVSTSVVPPGFARPFHFSRR